MHDEVLFESWSKFPIVLGCNSEYAENCDLSYQLQCQAERQGPWTSCYHKLTWGHKCEKKNIQTTSSGQPHWQSKWHLPGNLTGRANGIFLETSLAEQMTSSWKPHWQSKWHLPGNLTGRANGIFLATSLAEQIYPNIMYGPFEGPTGWSSCEISPFLFISRPWPLLVVLLLPLVSKISCV